MTDRELLATVVLGFISAFGLLCGFFAHAAPPLFILVVGAMAWTSAVTLLLNG